MSVVGDRYVAADSLSDAWLSAVQVAAETPSRRLVHLVIRIAEPTAEIPSIRASAQGLIDARNRELSTRHQLWNIETTRNSLFPAVWARRMPEPVELASYYRARYNSAGLLGFTANRRGTYFGRIVAYPRGGGLEPGDQLTDTVRKLRTEVAGGRAKSSRYEINIYNERLDTSPMSFPCLAHLSVHLHEGRLHMQGVYRNEYLIGRAYGNYLGMAELQHYIATAAGLESGELLITVNHAELDASRALVETRLGDLWRAPPSEDAP